MSSNTGVDSEILRAALLGYQSQLAEIDAKMAELRSRVEGGAAGTKALAPASVKRVLSVAARKRIAAAQRKRWAAAKKSAAPAKKRKLSAAGRKRIIAATRKRWAEFHARKKAAAKNPAA